jgi:hypothetical protein
VIKQILKHKNQFWLLVAMVLAFALRVYARGAQSLWNDEGNSVALAPQGDDNGQHRIKRTNPCSARPFNPHLSVVIPFVRVQKVCV